MLHVSSRSRWLYSVLLLSFILLPLVLILLVSCLGMLDTISGVTPARIRERGKLIAVTTYGENSYFIYRGEPFGFEYELLTHLADHLGVSLEVHLADGSVPLIDVLNSKRGDLIAAHITVTRKRLQEYDFTDHILTTRQVLVQRKGGHGEKPLRNVIDLIGETVVVTAHSHYYERLMNLSEEIGGSIDIQTVSHEVTEEDLVKKVIDGTIRFTIADETLAMINQLYYPDIDIETPVSFPQRIAWIVRRQSPEMLEYVNSWIAQIRRDGTLQALYRKYYQLDRVMEQKISFSQDPENKDSISQYDSLIRKYTPLINWDWRLIASLIYQESRFNPNARSWAGAVGLMQIMPGTARMLAMKNRRDPEENIQGGIRHIKSLIELWTAEIGNEKEMEKFILAAYNAGSGHVEDARRLAIKYGKDPDIWYNNVEEYILKLSNPEYYNDPVVQNGYCRGTEPYNYVRDILERYETYKKHIPLIPNEMSNDEEQTR